VIDLRLGDCLEIMRGMADASVDAIVCDPPAGISFMGKAFDHHRGGRTQWVAWLAEILRETLRVARPGSNALVWALPRTSHWTGTAIEDAGWRVADRLCHLHAQGFPKHKYLLKPAVEDWWLATKPGGAKWLGVEQCRIGNEVRHAACTSLKPCHGNRLGADGTQEARRGTQGEPKRYDGRWPANTVLSHHPECECVGVKRVRGSHDSGKAIQRAATDRSYSGAWKGAMTFGHTDPDGRETVESWKCVDGCPVAELDRQSGTRAPKVGREGLRGGSPLWGQKGMGSPDKMGRWPDDPGGGASRFYVTFPPDPDDLTRFRCDLCSLLSDDEIGTISWEHSSQEIEPCRSVSSAETSSSPPPITSANGSVRGRARAGQQPESEASNPRASTSANSADGPSPTSPETDGSIAADDAASSQLEQIVRNVKSAANLCDSCAIGIARNLVRIEQYHDPESLPGPASISEPLRRILNRSLANLAESLPDTDTIPTTASLKLWFGFVQNAITEFTTLGENGVIATDRTPHQGSIKHPYIYCPKASRSERNAGLEGIPEKGRDEFGMKLERWPDGSLKERVTPKQKQINNHPCVKSISLMRWLCRLACPPGGVILDPFCGSGSTGVACIQEGFGFIGIEAELEYYQIGERRLAAAQAETPLFREVAT
jgi:DNA modification methylase